MNTVHRVISGKYGVKSVNKLQGRTKVNVKEEKKQ